jgi:hypothetical protein
LLEYAVPISFSCMMCGWDGFLQRYITQHPVNEHGRDPEKKTRHEYTSDGGRMRWNGADKATVAAHIEKMNAARLAKSPV